MSDENICKEWLAVKEELESGEYDEDSKSWRHRWFIIRDYIQYLERIKALEEVAEATAALVDDFSDNNKDRVIVTLKKAGYR